ncbi:hypothetical protein ACS52_24590 [Bacillus cereus]|nr:hypothetical protein ACS52_24590 [Bacillus cereus]
MSDIEKELNPNIPQVTDEMIIDTILGDWEEYYGELKMNAYATSRRIIEELGSYYSNPKTKMITLTLLAYLVNKNSSNDLMAVNFIIKETNHINMNADIHLIREREKFESLLSNYIT